LIALIINVHTLGRMHSRAMIETEISTGVARPDIDKKDQLAS
jgi:hypothetical protein